MGVAYVVFRRELGAYFATPLAYVFIVIFLALSGAFTFYLGGFFQRGQADLQSFFVFHPWLYLFLIPAVSMRLWAEERKTGTIEVLMTLPVTTFEAVLAKFLAAWAFVGIAVVLTFPMWITVNYLGRPDNGTILAGYVGSLLMAGAYLAVGAAISAATRNQVIAFIVAAVACFLLLASGLEIVLAFFRGWAPAFLVDAIAAMSFITHFDSITKGIIDVRDVIFFLSVVAASLYVNVAVVELKKGA
ncbi:MAG: ABC transporter permease [Candidatus Rokubacteria bacterium]|nr:ABC transporter permease [Candidatus Rokubacteria bacterium]